jgi:hypothetical protein
METTFLYRGVSLELHKKNKEILIPKTNSFVQGLTLDTELAVLNSGIELGITENNAAFAHQIDAGRLPERLGLHPVNLK